MPRRVVQEKNGLPRNGFWPDNLRGAVDKLTRLRQARMVAG